jgi:hypothetical protein
MSYITKECTVLKCDRCEFADWAHGDYKASREYFEDQGWIYGRIDHVCPACQEKRDKI